MLFLNECTKPTRACLPIHSISIHTTHMQYTECFHVDLSVYNVFIVHPKEQCGNVNQAGRPHRCTFIMQKIKTEMYDVNSLQRTKPITLSPLVDSFRQLPPTRSALYYHAWRSAYVSGYLCGRADLFAPEIPAFVDWGWEEVFDLEDPNALLLLDNVRHFWCV